MRRVVGRLGSGSGVISQIRSEVWVNGSFRPFFTLRILPLALKCTLTLVVNFQLLCDAIIRESGFNVPRQQCSLLKSFRTEQGHWGACRMKWRLTDSDLCPCGETRTIFHIVKSCPLTKLNGDLSRLHSADEDAVSWLTNYDK